MKILKLEYSLREYAWGSTTELSRLLAVPNPDSRPQAELWWGAHESAPSALYGADDGATLADRIAADAASALGSRVAERFAGSLPFLLKVLAAAQPLSLQAHPDAGQALAGFARENEAGIPLTAPNRSYRDPRPKPELLCALSPFEALLGFRSPDAVHAGLAALQIAELAGPLSLLVSERDAPPEPLLRGFFSDLLNLERGARARIARAAAAHCRAAEPDTALGWVGRLAEVYPDDIGVLSPLILNHLCLEPGEAIYLPAGELHSYLCGTAVEIMANSDNVLRAGLTRKFVDVPELLRVLTWSMGPPQVLRPEGSEGEAIYRTPALEFELSRFVLTRSRSQIRFEVRGAEIVLCLAGELSLVADASGDAVELTPGDAAFVPGDLVGYRTQGEGTAFRATVPLD